MTQLTPLPQAYSAGPRPTSVVLAVIAAALICLGGAWITLNAGAPFSFDRSWHSAVGVSPGSIGYVLAVTLAAIGSSIGVGVCVVAAAAWLFALRRGFDALVLICTALIGVGASELLKALVARPRPIDALLQPHGLSYPSGHSMGAAMLATALVFILLANRHKQRAAVWLYAAAGGWVLLMMWSRTALHVHWLSDTIAGALLGWCAAVLVRAAMRQLPPLPWLPARVEPGSDRSSADQRQ